MTDAICGTASTPVSDAGILTAILSTVAFNFAVYLSIGLSLAILPGFVHHTLGFSAVVAGMAISMQYLATLISRPQIGRMSDRLGPKRTVLTGIVLCGVSGLTLLFGGLTVHMPLLSLTLIMLARLALGCAESCVGTGSITWGMGQVGHQHTARVISWNGVATYTGLAAGAPLGVIIEHAGGLEAIGGVSAILMLLAFPLARLKRAIPVAAGERSPLREVAAKVVPYGVALALGSIGFGCIATFITLLYHEHHWGGAATTLSVFGLMFAGTRFVFGWTIVRVGGYWVGMASFAAEAVGLAILCMATSATLATVGAAIAGMGFSLVFPALGVEAVRRIPEHSRGTALGLFSVFLDVAMALTGPIGGWAAGGMGYNAIYGYAAMAGVLAVALTFTLKARDRMIGSGSAAS